METMVSCALAERRRQNSKFFRAKTSNQSRRNILTSIKNESKEWLEEARLDDYIVTYFRNLFSAKQERGPLDFLSDLGNKLSDSMRTEMA